MNPTPTSARLRRWLERRHAARARRYAATHHLSPCLTTREIPVTRDQPPHPRITAQVEYGGVSNRVMFDVHDALTPHVEITVSFDLDDHDAAMALLEKAIDDVRAQIAKVAP